MSNSTSAIHLAFPNLIGIPLRIFEEAFDLYGTLDRHGDIRELHGRIFEKTSADPGMLAGQPFRDTVFWQSAENTARRIDEAVKDALEGNPSPAIVDFRISADERAAVELFVHRLEDDGSENVLFVCARRVVPERSEKNPLAESDQILLAAENADIGLWFWDEAEKRLYSTPLCKELFELTSLE